MQVSITERHCEVPTRVLDRTEVQIGKLSKFENRATRADVVYSEENRARKVEVVVHVDGAGQVAAKGEGDNFRKALDQAVDRMSRILRDQRERRRDHQGPSLAEGLAASTTEERAEE